MIERFERHPTGTCVGHYRDLYLTGWSSEVTVPALQRIRAHRLEFLRRHEGPAIAVQMIFLLRAKMLPREARQLVEQINADAPDRFRAEAFYVAAGGVALSAVRFVIAGIQLVNGTKWPLEVFGEVPGATRWLAGYSATPEGELSMALRAFERLARG